MAFITDLIKSGKQYLWQTLCAPFPPKKIFEEGLLKFMDYTISHEECVKACVESVKSVLQPADCDLSDASQQVIDSHINDFYEAVRATPHLLVSESSQLKADFKRRLGVAVGEKWAEAMAESFYGIARTTEEKEKAVAAQKWTDRYFQGLGYLKRCECEFGTTVTKDFVANFVDKTFTAFHVYSHELIQKRMETMQRKVEKDPIGFAKKCESVEVKVENGPGTVISDKEIEQLVIDLANGLLMQWPSIDENCEILKRCIWSGFTLKQMQLSILDPEWERLFYSAKKLVAI